MNNKHIFQTILFAVIILVFSVTCWFKLPDEYSESERRELEKRPEFSVSKLISGKFMSSFEDYTLDQIPLRDEFRTVKALANNYIFRRLDNNGIYITSNGIASKIEYPIDENSLENASKKFRYIYEKYLVESNSEVFLSVIPDKNAFIANEEGYLVMDYEKLYEIMRDECEFAEYIDISDLLSIDDYYKTDTHWKQESILDVAKRLSESLGVTVEGNYNVNTLNKDFYGVYYGQSALPLEPDTIKYLTNDTLDDCIVYDYQNNKEITMYDMEKADGKDPYELFLSGSLSLITIENPNSKSDKEIVIFRDSFGSSLIPLLCSGYKSVTVVDIRYISSIVLEKYINFENKDVLFIYSTLVLNNSAMLK